MSMHVIAEAGQTMRGNVGRAVDMVHRFAQAGATDFKVQMIDPDKLATPDAAAYWHTGGHALQHEQFLRNGLIPHNGWDRVRQACYDAHVGFGATPFDLDAVDALADLQPHFVKVASGDITYLPLLRRIGQKFPSTPIVMSCGASTFDEIITAMRMLNDSGANARSIVPMACTLRYPAAEALLHRITDLLRSSIPSHWAPEVGYSDHTMSVETGMHAALAGATWIEKHVTPWGGRNSDATPDDAMGLTDVEFRQYVDGVHGAMKLLGDTGLSGDEMDARIGARRAARYDASLKAGDIPTEYAFTFLRPSPDGTGDSIAVAQHAVDDSTPLCRDVKAGDVVSVGDFVLP